MSLLPTFILLFLRKLRLQTRDWKLPMSILDTFLYGLNHFLISHSLGRCQLSPPQNYSFIFQIKKYLPGLWNSTFLVYRQRPLFPWREYIFSLTYLLYFPYAFFLFVECLLNILDFRDRLKMYYFLHDFYLCIFRLTMSFIYPSTELL